MLRMQHCTVVSHNGTQQLVKMTGKRKNQVIASIVVDPCTGYDEATTRSYFLRAYRWAPFWHPVLRVVADAGRPAINRDCTLAITYGYMGQSLGSGKLQIMAQGLYGETLRKVRSLIQLSTQVELAWLIPSILLMAMYNFSVEEGSGNVHIEGLNQILQHCGPECFQQETLLQIYRSCRTLHACHGIVERRGTFLAKASWKTVPWKFAEKTTEDRLFDILLDIPGLVEDIDVFGVDVYSRLEIDLLIYKLHEWRLDWQSKNKDAILDVAGQFVDKFGQAPTLNDIMSQPMEFATLSQALEIFYYDAALVYLWMLRDLGSGSLNQIGNASSKDIAYICRVAREPLLPGQIRFRCQPAVEAFRITRFIRKQLIEGCWKGQFIPPAPFGMIYWALKDGSEEMQSHFAPILSESSVFNNGDGVFGGWRVAGNLRAGGISIAAVGPA
ncbi:hypothetical protein ESCO_001704 [Escovopsis weberi]|uniref:Uncharacterized protein n=1 Tax=Escovopsis weberi TaxID=150374 RepID=A0A0M8N0G5_ESCWE|nr:hypothetical protein ESCO_001704 [Escovopsis weberi]